MRLRYVCSKGFLTINALKQSFSIVNSLMIMEGRDVAKWFSTFTAHIRSFTSVNSPVFNIIDVCGKGFLTFITLIGLFPM